MAECRHCTRPKPLTDEHLADLLRQVLLQHAWTEAPAEMAHARRQRCAACPHRQPPDTCGICGCLLSIRTRILEQDCPDPAGSRWG